MDDRIVDLVIALVLLAHLLEGLRRGVVAALAEFLALVLALAVGLAFYRGAAALLGARLGLPHGIASAAGFFLVWVVALLALSALAALLSRLVPGFLQRSLVSRVLALVPALAHGLLVSALAVTLLVSLPLAGPVKAAILQSRLGGPLVDGASVFNGYVSDVIGGAVQDTLTMLTVHPGSDERVELNFRTDDTRVDEAAEARMLELLNQERVRAGLKPLQVDAPLRDVGRAHARDMLRRGYFGHVNPEGQTPFDRMRAAGVRYTAAGENLALAPSVEIAHQGLMNSPGHRANILSPDFGRVGVGVIDAGRYGEMFTQEFTD